MSNISLITKIYKSRKIILDQLKIRGYDISEYENFSFNEIYFFIRVVGNKKFGQISYNDFVAAIYIIHAHYIY